MSAVGTVAKAFTNALAKSKPLSSRKGNKKSARRKKVKSSKKTSAMLSGPTRMVESKRQVTDTLLVSKSIPVSTSMGFSSSKWNFLGPPSRTADFDSSQGIRIGGTALWGTLGYSGNAGIPMSSYCLNNYNGTGSGVYSLYKPIGPQEVDARLAALASCFTFYAFRRVRFYYVPNVSANTNLASNVSYALGVSDDSDDSSAAQYFTPGQIMDVDPSAYFQSVLPTSFEYEHKGTRLWNCSTYNETDNLENYQLLLLGLSSLVVTAQPPSAFTSGVLLMEYVVDLYRPTAPTNQVSVERKQRDDEKKHSAVITAATPMIRVDEPCSTTSITIDEKNSSREERTPFSVARPNILRR